MADRERVVVEGGELHRVFDEARAGGEPRLREAREARIVGSDRLMDPLEVRAVALGDEIELVRDREGEIAVGVGEELGKLRLDGRDRKDLHAEGCEQRAGALGRRGRGACDDLRQPIELVEGVALRDALRAVGDVDRRATFAHAARQPVGHPGEDGAAENEELAGAHAIEHAVDGAVEGSDGGIEELVNRGADGDDDDLVVADPGARGGHREPSARERGRQGLVRAALEEGHAARGHRTDPSGVGVDQRDAEPSPREGDSKREPDVAAATDDRDRDVWRGLLRFGGGLRRAGRVVKGANANATRRVVLRVGHPGEAPPSDSGRSPPAHEHDMSLGVGRGGAVRNPAGRARAAATDANRIRASLCCDQQIAAAHAAADQRLAGEHEDAVRARVWVARGATIREKRGAAPVEVKRNETQTLDPDVRAGRETGLRHGSRSALGIYRNEPSAVFVRCNELTPEVAE